jgi:hypothetical protein
MPNQIAAAPARRAEHRQHAIERGRVLGEQREINAAPADRLQQVEQSHDRLVAARGVDPRASSARCATLSKRCRLFSGRPA